ncbi:hypothetical protein FNV43_RR03214 [Rhamnella rubrinervis]|uniref:AP2/ERF domain-containing protein n=1 Tax=Rhamnella rubrinervis TaxID=2594499 RepID=A0A8K0MNH3_9ROSA|nr:hypothetical protein FNV43_RR03214 [Rhamnella rubrinervis]
MDSSSHQNWLGFSLSNHPHLHSHPSHHHLSLFEAFSSPNPASVVDTTTTTTAVPREEGHAHAVPPGATNLGLFTEDFLGGCRGSAAANTATPSLAHFSTETPITLPDTELYDSELKTIAASFLRGYTPTEQTNTGRNQLPVAPVEPTTKKTVDTFGQRIDGLADMKLTCGITAAEEKDKVGKEDKDMRKNVGRVSDGLLCGYDKEEKAARAYDLAALKYWGPTTTTNFPVSNYEKELEDMKNMTRQEFVASLRRKSSGFSRGASIYRGVTRHHQHGRWQARIGRVAGNKDLYLGTFSTQEEAAEAYDIAAIKFRGLNAVTNFDMGRYDVKSIANSNLPIGGMSGKSKNSSESFSDRKSVEGSRSADDRDLSSASSVSFASKPTSASTLSFAIPIKQDPSDYWSNIFGFHNQNPCSSLSTGGKNPSSLAPTLFHSSTNGSSSAVFQSSSSVPFNMDFSASPNSASESNNGYFNSSIGYAQQQQQSSGTSGSGSGSSSTVAFSTQIALNSNNSYESSSGYGSWIGPTLHTFQTHAKPNLFQTPIFGME